jgi:hypothetical protein
VIVVRLWGGLGNQMFQYALGRRLAIANDVPLKLDLSALVRDPLRRFGCDLFCIRARIAVPADLAMFSEARPARAGRSRPASWWRVARRPRAVKVKERSLTFDPAVLATRSPALLFGYWQSERYFVEISPTIRADFRLAEPMTAGRNELLGRIASCNAVSVHIRRGDYVTNPAANAFHGTIDAEWYRRSLDLMVEWTGDPTFFVFSDDPAAARALLQTDRPTVFVDPGADGRDAEDLHLMAACRHHVIANSSFSWWGAWLNPNPARRVIAPAEWFVGVPTRTGDRVPPGWIVL